MQENKKYNTVQLATEMALKGGLEGAGRTTDYFYGVGSTETEKTGKAPVKYAEELALNGGMEGAGRTTDALYE